MPARSPPRWRGGSLDGARRRRRRRLRTTYQLPKALGIDVEELILTLSLGRVCGDSLSPSPSLFLCSTNGDTAGYTRGSRSRQPRHQVGQVS